MLKSYFEGGNSADVNQAYLGKFVTWKLPKRSNELSFNGTIAAMAKHFYWGFKCKTENCSIPFHPAKYIGETEKNLAIYALPQEMPESFDYRCRRCGTTHRYMRSEMKPFFLDERVPSEDTPWF
jgi:hypothetical protein